MPDFNAQGPQDPNTLNSRLRSVLMANWVRIVLIGLGLFFFVMVVVPGGLLIYQYSGIGDKPQEGEGAHDKQKVEAANSKPLTGQCLGQYRSFEGDVDYSPDGQKIVFASSYYYDGPGSSVPSSADEDATVAPGTRPSEADNEICVVNADGTGMVRLTDDSYDESFAVWSPDGNKIAFIRDFIRDYETSSAIVIMNADGSNEVKLPGTLLVAGDAVRAIDWSPDGESIVFAAGDGISLTRTDGSSTPRRLTTDPPWQLVDSPTWSPDGKQIAFTSERGTGPYIGVGEPTNIYVMNVSGDGGTNEWRQLTDGPATEASPAWSPDGTEIAFTRAGDADSPGGIYKVDADGSNETRLTSGGDPTWLPDGKHLAYLDNGNIEVVNADGSNPTLVVADTVE